MTNPIVTVEDVSFKYDYMKVLDNISFVVNEGSFVGLVGPNGSGKTTLIKLLLGIEKLQKGKIELFGQPIQKFKNKGEVSFVSQKSNSFNRGFPATVKEVVEMGIAKEGTSIFRNKKDHLDKVKQALKEVDMLDYFHRNIGELSGGQQQRIFIARAIVNDPKLLILDEPTVGIDTENVQQFYQLLLRLNKELKMTLILVSHDTAAITTHVNDLLCLNKTIFYHGNPADYENMSDEERSKLYGHHVHTIIHDH